MIKKYTGKDIDRLIEEANSELVQEVEMGDAVVKMRFEVVSISAILQSHNGEFIIIVGYKQA